MSKGTSKMSRLMRAPFRALGRACDFYVNSMTRCAGRVPYDSMAMGCPAPLASRSFSFSQHRTLSEEDEDLRQLIRAVSLSHRAPVRRSQSVAVGRIDEEGPCNFRDEVRVGSSLLFSRSLSCAFRPRRNTTKVAA